MQSIEVENPRDREMVVKHQHSFSESRSNIPMWDSADPDRAPPPLPLNPGTNSPTTRPNASATVRAAAAALAEKSNDNTPSSYTTNPMPLKPSPEKSLVKGPYHKRMQSLQNTTNTTSSKEFASYLERRSPEKSSRTSIFDRDNQTNEKSPTRTGTSTPPGHESPTYRPSSRYLGKPLLGENTPPSATMLALQNMQIPIDLESPSSPSNRSNAATNTTKEPRNLDALSEQIIGLTTIATSLQQEMSQLSRRSKDNATDLVSLKAATNARDEDIRKSLKDLSINLSTKAIEGESSTQRGTPFIHPATGGFMIDNKAHDSSPSSKKSFTIPRIPSPNSFAAALERDVTTSPGAISTDGSASIALLEKVLREMATKEGQEKLLTLMEEVKGRPNEKDTDSSMSNILEEILNLVKENSGSRALVRSRDGGAQRGLDFDIDNQPLDDMAGTMAAEMPRTAERSSSEINKSSVTQPTDVLTEDMLDSLKRVKNSVAEGGGLTNEVKRLVRELRGEVLGMGRELARKLEQVEANRMPDVHSSPGPGKHEIEQIVDGGLADLRHHMEQIILENHRSSSASDISRSTVDNQEVYMAVRKAMDEAPLPQQAITHDSGAGLQREEVLDAVREAWETYKPEIELQNFGLERDEILECLTEGLKSYQPQQESIEPETIYQQVLDAVHHGLQEFTPPRVECSASTSQEEIIAAIRDCLESFEWPIPPAVLDREETIKRDDVLDAVKEGLATQERQPNEIEINRDDIFEAVRVGFHDASNALSDNVGEQVIEHLHGLIIEMKDEFKQYSAANGRDTEQVLDAVKDGLEVLRGEVESYVDRASDVTGKDEIIDTVKDGFQLLQSDVERCIANPPQNQPSDTVELLDAMEKEFEHLRQTLSSLLIRNNTSSDKDEILDAIRDITESQQMTNNDVDVSETIKEELEHLRETLSMAIVKPDSSTDQEEVITSLRLSLESLFDDYIRKKDGSESVLSNTGELLDAFHDGVDLLRADMDKVLNKTIDSSPNDELLESLKEGLAEVMAEIGRLRENQESDDRITTRGGEVMLANDNSIGSDIESLKALVTQLQIKVDAIDVNPVVSGSEPDVAKKDDLLEVLASLREIQDSVVEVKSREPPEEGSAKKEDTDAIEALLQGMTTQLDELASSANASWVTAERVESLEALVKETKDTLGGFAAHVEMEGPSKTDVTNLEAIMKDIWVAVEDLKTNENSSEEEDAEKVVKGDVKNLEALLFELKSQMEELNLPDVDALPTKDDVNNLTHLVAEFKEKIDEDSQLTAQAFESRKIEHGGIAEKVEEVKSFICGLRDEFKSKASDSEGSLVDLKTLLECLTDSTESFAKAENLKELADLVKRESERLHGDREASKMEEEERETSLLAKIDENQGAIMSELSVKIEDKFNDILLKYDDAQTAAEAKFAAAEERDMHSLDTLTSTKSLTEDLKLVIGGMGESVTEACDRMNDDSKTFFGRVDESFAKVDDLQLEVQTHHEDMKGQFDKALAATDRLESQISQSHPELLSSIKEILGIVGQHYEHSRKSAEELKTDLSTIPSAIPALLPALPAPPSPTLSKALPEYEKYDDTQVHNKLDSLINHTTATEKYDDSQVHNKLDSLINHTTAVEKYDDSQVHNKLDSIINFASATEKYDDSQVHNKLDSIMDLASSTEKYDDSQVHNKLDSIINLASTTEKYDDSHVHGKLDSLMNHAASTEKSVAQIEKLDQIHEQIMETAREVSEMMATQSRIANQEQEDKKNEALEASIALEKRLAQKDKVEAEVVTLNEEKASLVQDIQTLRQEKMELTKDNMKLTKEVGGMETALRIRQEEVQLMEDRAEDLERRIVEGVLDHARSQLLSRPQSNMDPMSLKRVSSVTSTSTRGTVTSTAKDSSVLGSGVGMALKRRAGIRPNTTSTAPSNSGNERRILSLNHVSSNRGPAGRKPTALSSNGGLTNLKRSHSVKTNYAFRKASWDTRNTMANKENEVFPEEDENISEDESDTGTERRTSFTGTYTDSESYMTESIVSTDRNTSYSSTNGLVAAEQGSWIEPSEDSYSQYDETRSEDADSENDQNVSYVESDDMHDDTITDTNSEMHGVDGSEMGVYPHSDSGLGKDIPSASSEKAFAVK